MRWGRRIGEVRNRMAIVRDMPPGPLGPSRLHANRSAPIRDIARLGGGLVSLPGRIREEIAYRRSLFRLIRIIMRITRAKVANVANIVAFPVITSYPHTIETMTDNVAKVM